MTLLAKTIGGLELAVGLVALYYAPLEIYCFYVFAPGGSFFYPEFTVGSLWFALLVMSNIVYYLMAITLIPLGMGTLRLRGWAHHLSRVALSVCLMLGISLTAGFAFGAPQFIAGIGLGNTTALLAVSVVLTIGAPVLLLRLYQAAPFAACFGQAQPPSLIEQVPASVLRVCALSGLFIILLHVSIFLRCFMPWFGRVLLRREGIYLLCAAIFVLSLLVAGMWQRRVWAFWGLLTYFLLAQISITLTFSRYSLREIIDLMGFAQVEHDTVLAPLSVWLNLNIPAALTTWIVLTLAALVYAGRVLRPPQLGSRPGHRWAAPLLNR